VRLKLAAMGAGRRFASLDEVERHLRDTCKEFGPLEDRQWRRLAEHDSRRGENGAYTLALDPAVVNSMRRGGSDGVEFGSDFLFGIDLWPTWTRSNVPRWCCGSGVGSPARIDRQADAGRRSARRIRGIPGWDTRRG